MHFGMARPPPMLPPRLLFIAVLSIGIIPAANCQTICLGTCENPDDQDVPQETISASIEPWHPLADTNSAVFGTELAEYLNARQKPEVGTGPQDPLHPLADTESTDFKSAMDAYQTAVATARADAQTGPIDPLHPLADTDSDSFKSELAAYVEAQQRARIESESSLPDAMRPPSDGPANPMR